MEQLREFIRGILAEKAVLAGAAAQSGLAMLANNTGHGVEVILYDPTFAANTISSVVQAAKEDESLDVSIAIDSAIEESVCGYIRLNDPKHPCNGAMEVGMSAANKGYGPLMYDIAMSMSPNGIIPDRKNVSNDARSIWQKYHSRGAGVHGSVYIKKLDNVDEPETPDPSDDCSMQGKNPDLNSSYSGASVDTSKFEANHQKFLASVLPLVKLLGIKKNSLERRVIQSGDQFFSAKYLEGGM